MVDNYSVKMNFSDSYTWDIDQHIVSYAIMSSGYCSLPADNKLWEELHLEPKYEDLKFSALMRIFDFFSFIGYTTTERLVGTAVEYMKTATTSCGAETP